MPFKARGSSNYASPCICARADGYGVPNGVSGGSSVVVNGTSANGPDAASRQSNSLLIVDARSYAAAVANRAKGGGCECQGQLPYFVYWCMQWTILCNSCAVVFQEMTGPGGSRGRYTIGPIRLLAGWRKRRHEPGLVWFR